MTDTTLSALDHTEKNNSRDTQLLLDDHQIKMFERRYGKLTAVAARHAANQAAQDWQHTLRHRTNERDSLVRTKRDLERYASLLEKRFGS